jgi:hypothetical protein
VARKSGGEILLLFLSPSAKHWLTNSVGHPRFRRCARVQGGKHLREWLFHSQTGVGVGVRNSLGVVVGTGVGANNLLGVDSGVDFLSEFCISLGHKHISVQGSGRPNRVFAEPNRTEPNHRFLPNQRNQTEPNHPFIAHFYILLYFT